MAEPRTGPKFGQPTFKCYICPDSIHRTPRSASTHSQGSCEWFKHNCEALWVLWYWYCGPSNPKRPYDMEALSGGRETLEEACSEKDLGIHKVNSLKPTFHCQKAAKKAISSLRLLRNAFDKLTVKNFKIVFTTYVRPHGSSEDHEMLKRNDKYHSIADDVPIPKNVIFIKIVRLPFFKNCTLCPTRYFFVSDLASHLFTRRRAFSSPTE